MGVGAPAERDRPDPRERLLLAGEELIAERGMDVPLRDVAAAAGQRNNSAVHYYFGSRDGLIRAILERRQEPLEARRLELLAEHEARGGADEVRELVEILIRPMFHVPYETGSTHYARFLEQVRTHPLLSEPVNVNLQHWPGSKIVVSRLGRALADHSPAVRRRRIESMATVMFALMADQERHADGHGLADPATLDDIVTMLVGLLTATP